MTTVSRTPAGQILIQTDLLEVEVSPKQLEAVAALTDPASVTPVLARALRLAHLGPCQQTWGGVPCGQPPVDYDQEGRSRCEVHHLKALMQGRFATGGLR